MNRREFNLAALLAGVSATLAINRIEAKDGPLPGMKTIHFGSAIDIDNVDELFAGVKWLPYDRKLGTEFQQVLVWLPKEHAQECGVVARFYGVVELLRYRFSSNDIFYELASFQALPLGMTHKDNPYHQLVYINGCDASSEFNIHDKWRESYSPRS
jgi:hypothetical protein